MSRADSSRKPELEAMSYLAGTAWLLVGVAMAFLLLQSLSYELLRSMLAALAPLALLVGG